MFFFDHYYWLLVVPALLVTVWAQFKVKSAFHKYSQMGVRSGMTGAEASREIQRQNGISVALESVAGAMTDHYDPRTNVIRLSEPVGQVSSVAAVGVAAHETGHALQYANGYMPIKIRSVILPTTRIASTIAPYLFLAGMLLYSDLLAYLGLAFFGVAVLFQLLTLPVEFNASARAMKALREGGMMTEEELKGVRQVLTAAAMTYVASMLVALMSFLRLILLLSRRNRD